MKKKDIEYFKNVLTHQLEELEIKNTHTVLKMDDVS